MKKRTTILMALVLSLLLIMGTAQAYTPPPGVKSPDEVDFGGKTITFVQSWSVLGDVKEESKSRFAGRLEKAEELFNCEIEEVTGYSAEEYYETVMGRILSGEAEYDIYWLPHNRGLWKLLGNKRFYPVSEILPDEYFENLPAQDKMASKILTLGDKRYGFGRNIGFKGKPLNLRLTYSVYNPEIIEEEGLPDPMELFEEGNWTWEEADNIIRKATKDTDGDGENDQYGLAFHPSFLWPVAFATTNGELPFIKTENGYDFNFDKPAVFEAYNQLQEWMKYRHPSNNPDNLNGFLDGNVALAIPVTGTYLRFPAKKMESGTWEIIPMPKGPKAEKHTFFNWEYSSWFIPLNAADPEGLIALQSYLKRPDDPYELGGDAKTIVGESKERYEFLTKINEELWEGEGNPFFATSFSDAVYEVQGQIFNEEESPASVIKEIAPEIQTQLDDLFGRN